MREIKFRAWDRIGNSMIFFNMWGIPIEPTPYVNIDYYATSWMQSARIEVMQYTGLKDKNGVEIYEGDFLSVDWPEQRYSKHTTGPVKWDRSEACWQLGEGAEPEYDAKNYMEVIGNIYENPELLEER